MRRILLVAGLVVAVALLFGSSVLLVVSPVGDVGPTEPAPEPEVYQLDGYESGVWPYLNRAPEPVERSPINIIVRGDTDRVVTALMRHGDGDWEETPEAEYDADPETYAPGNVTIGATEIQWGEAAGATRYTYVHDGTDGEWVTETQQIHDGTYFGDRTHVRLYESPHPDESWVAMQAHTEHFDWFTLRHAVTGVEEAQRQIESDLMGAPLVDRVSREHLGNDGPYDSDGWGTIVELAALLLVSSISVSRLLDSHLTPVDRDRIRAARDRIGLEHLLLTVAVGSIPLLVRAAGLGLEAYTSLGVHTIAALLYPVMAVGIPAVAYAFARSHKHRLDAALCASVGLALGFLIDYAYVTIDALPISIILHRVGVILAIGLVAGGAAQRATRETRLNELAVTGLLLWIVLLTAVLFGFI